MSSYSSPSSRHLPPGIWWRVFCSWSCRSYLQGRRGSLHAPECRGWKGPCRFWFPHPVLNLCVSSIFMSSSFPSACPMIGYLPSPPLFACPVSTPALSSSSCIFLSSIMASSWPSPSETSELLQALQHQSPSSDSKFIKIIEFIFHCRCKVFVQLLYH